MFATGAIVSLLAVTLLLVLAARLKARRTIYRFALPVEPELPVREAPPRADETVKVMSVARRKAEERAWQVAKELAEQRAKEESERHLFEVAQRMAERRAWQVAMELAKYNRPHSDKPAHS